MIISRVAANKGLFLFGGCIVGVLVGHVVIRLIYRCELKPYWMESLPEFSV